MAPKKPARAKKPAARRSRAKTEVQTDRGPSAQDEAAKDTGQPDPEVTEGLSQIDDGDSAVAVDTSDRRQPLDYEPVHMELEHAGFDHHGAEAERQAELTRERDEHNARTGDASR